MRPKEINFDVADASLTGFRSDATGVDFALTATAATDGLAHQVSIRNDTANDHAGKTFTLVGTDADGKAQTEEIAGPGASATVESTKYFLSLESVTPSATIGADTMDIGWVDEIASRTIMLDWRSEFGARINVDVTGTLDFTVEQTFEDINNARAPQDAQQDVNWQAIAALEAKTADTFGEASVGATAIRLRFNSHSSGAEARMHINQPTGC